MYQWQLNRRKRRIFVTLGVIWFFITGATITLSILNGEDLRSVFIVGGADDIKLEPADMPLREPTEKELLLKSESERLARQLDLEPFPEEEVELGYEDETELSEDLFDDEIIP